jgi:hypothetical protein
MVSVRIAPAENGSFIRRILSRLALIALGIALSLFVAEALLSGGALVVRLGNRPDIASTQSTQRILCLGDSNTYGLYLPHSQAYPAILQRRWDAEGTLAAAEIVNMGVPGTNSSRLRVAVDRILQLMHPGVVMIMIGVNDAWTVPVPLNNSESRVQWLWDHSRVFRLLFMIRRAMINRRPGRQGGAGHAPQEGSNTNHGVSIEFVPPARKQPRGIVHAQGQDIDLSFTRRRRTASPGWTKEADVDIRAIIDRIRRSGAKPILITYPADTQSLYYRANDVIRNVARSTRTWLIDVGAVFRANCPEGVCPELLQPNYHATAKGNELVANTIVQFFLANERRD